MTTIELIPTDAAEFQISGLNKISNRDSTPFDIFHLVSWALLEAATVATTASAAASTITATAVVAATKVIAASKTAVAEATAAEAALTTA